MKKFKVREFSPLWWAGMMAAAAVTAVGVCLIVGGLLTVWEIYFV